jgi:hypothetical protein
VRDIARRERVRRQKYFGQKSKIQKSTIAKRKNIKNESFGKFCERKTTSERKRFKPPRSAENWKSTLASFLFIVPVIQ